MKNIVANHKHSDKNNDMQIQSMHLTRHCSILITSPSL